MRFKKGSKVEVLTKSSVPSGAWRSAQIISGNGHYYTVMYDSEEGITQRVPRKRTRPGQGTSRLSAQTSERKDKLNESHVLSIKGPKKRTYSLVQSHNQATQVKVHGSSSRALHLKGKEEEEDDIESVASSTGSCNMDIYGLTNVSFGHIETSNSSDTESSSCGYTRIKTKKSNFPAKGSEAADVHRLELDAYRSSIERLHAAGPIITWEQETWITNLRLRLNISNEEHLMQIRNLISDDNSTTYR